MEKKDFIKVILFFFSIFVIITLLVVSGCISREVSEVRSGVISDKNYVEEQTYLFSHQYAGYRIYIDYEFDFFGATISGSKYFVVDKDTYLSYEIGDYFDIRNF